MDKFREIPILGILRGIGEEHIEKVTETIIASGLKTVEITMNTLGAIQLIKKMKNISQNKLKIGAGTVLNLNELSEALDAGAEFIVTPTLVDEVVEYCNKNSIPVFPGALTPTEIHKVWLAGATMVKVFPASLFGPEYIKEIKAPFNNIELMAVGGVSKDTIVDYFRMGASAVAFGASIFKKEYFETENYSAIKHEITQLLEVYLNWKIKNE